MHVKLSWIIINLPHVSYYTLQIPTNIENTIYNNDIIHFFMTVRERCENVEKDDFGQRTECQTPVGGSKYTTVIMQFM